MPVHCQGATGLVHISEVADAYVHDVKDHLKENDKIKVKVISIKKERSAFRSGRSIGPGKKARFSPPRSSGIRGECPLRTS